MIESRRITVININNKPWDKLRGSDIIKLLNTSDDETLFFEFKSDEESPQKLTKEISAFANTYGGYILLGVNNDKTIGGCHKWTELRIHTVVHDSITPTPNFDVRKFKVENKIILVIKIEEGVMPPYITNQGLICERVSSGSFPIKDSGKLALLYTKRQDQMLKIRNKIESEPIALDTSTPNNLCGYLDLGFSVTLSEITRLQKDFYRFDFSPIAEHIKSKAVNFSISRLGHSFLISIGKVTATHGKEEVALLPAGLQNFMEIMADGSVKCRILLTSLPNQTIADISAMQTMLIFFRKVYGKIFGKGISKVFIHAYKYEKLTVLKQFTPFYQRKPNSNEELFEGFLSAHKQKYGDNLIIESNRVPKNDYMIIDKRWFNEQKLKFSDASLLDELFTFEHINLGYVDLPPVNNEE